MQTLTCIDNCQLDRFILKKMLSAFGRPCDINCAGAGHEVIRQLTRNKSLLHQLPDIILLDIYMPGFDAWDFLDRINWLYPTLAKPVEIYILSASGYTADVARAKQYGFVKAFIIKPVTKEVIRQLLNHKKMPFSRFTALEAC